MQVILKDDVENLGRSGELVTVKDGYARNFLIPRGLAVRATKRNVKQLEHERRLIEAAERKRRAAAEALKDKLEGTSVSIARRTTQAGEEGEAKLYGSVTSRDIAEALAEKGIEVDRRTIQLDEPIRTLGLRTVAIRLKGGVSAEIKVWVVAEEEDGAGATAD